MGKEKKPIEQADPRTKARVQQVVEQMVAIPPSKMDPNGSYTGRPVRAGEVPVQDADDL